MKLREGVTVDGYASSYLTEDTEIKTTTQGNGVVLFEFRLALHLVHQSLATSLFQVRALEAKAMMLWPRHC